MFGGWEVWVLGDAAILYYVYANIVIILCVCVCVKIICTYMLIYIYIYHHHHHHVLEGLGMLACSLILKMKLVPPPLPRSSYVSSSVWFVF